jgi:hypothetical protein
MNQSLITFHTFFGYRSTARQYACNDAAVSWQVLCVIRTEFGILKKLRLIKMCLRLMPLHALSREELVT